MGEAVVTRPRPCSATRRPARWPSTSAACSGWSPRKRGAAWRALLLRAAARGGGRAPAADGARLRGMEWADAATLELVESLAARVRDVPLLLLALARPELLEHRPARAAACPATALPLEPLGPAQSQELANRPLTAASAAGFDAEAIAATSEGNPLFIEELAASLLEHAAAGGRASSRPRSARSCRRASTRSRRPSARLLDASVVGFWRGALGAMGPRRRAARPAARRARVT